jgi:hypothetical protein
MEINLMANHEDRPIRESVHLLLAFRRKKNNPELTNECIRIVIKDYDLDLFLLEEKCKRLGGVWRIHHTVNARDTEKARIWLIHKLIDEPKFAGCVDSIWKTALLQPECKAENNFLLDIDRTKNREAFDLSNKIAIHIEKWIKTPNGFHFITESFDTREICQLPYVTLIRDGYYFIKEIK